MHTTFRLLAVAACASLLYACAPKDDSAKTAAPAELTTDAQKFGYAIGVDLGNSLKPVKEHVDIAALEAGLNDVTNGVTPKLDDAAREEIKNTVSKQMQEEQVKKRQEQATKSKEEGEKFLAENAKKEGVKTTASGLQYEVLQEGSGTAPTAADKVTVHYRGTLLNGEEFDSSYSRGQPVTFPLANVIPGWTEGVQLMKPGAKYKFYIPSDLAYGERGAGVKIGPNETLIFEVELIEVAKDTEEPKK
jgi:FKBP-type peptidyl-prolyl cis-trans isomerase FkpA/FKBP-type peptidyl-prolyl cis-trans isomerase FklB